MHVCIFYYFPSLLVSFHFTIFQEWAENSPADGDDDRQNYHDDHSLHLYMDDDNDGDDDDDDDDDDDEEEDDGDDDDEDGEDDDDDATNPGPSPSALLKEEILSPPASPSVLGCRE